MTVKPIAAGMPQRIIQKINEPVEAVNQGGSGGSGTADAILDAATVADAGKALGIDAEGAPALIGTGAPLLRCSLTYTGTGTSEDPYVGRLDHASEILDALDRESAYDPIIVINWDFDGQQSQLIPTAVDHRIEQASEIEYLQAYGDVSTQNVSLAFVLATGDLGAGPVYMVNDNISLISTQNVTISDDAITFSAAASS